VNDSPRSLAGFSASAPASIAGWRNSDRNAPEERIVGTVRVRDPLVSCCLPGNLRIGLDLETAKLPSLKARHRCAKAPPGLKSN